MDCFTPHPTRTNNKDLATYIHSTSVDIHGSGIMILGKPGMGKSSLALQLIDRGAHLVADDQTQLSYDKEKLVLQPPERLKGMLEVRGVGLCYFSFRKQTSLKLCVEICEEDMLERLPDPLFKEYYEIKVPLLRIKKDDPLGPIKVELKLCHNDGSNVR